MDICIQNRAPKAMTLLLTRREIAALMTPQDYLEAVAQGFAAATAGRAESPAPLHVALAHGGFHAKAAVLQSARAYVALKFNANMPGNPQRYGLPTIQGTILLHDGDDGQLLAVMDSGEITQRRTAAATALAARYLARPESAVLAVCGCGAQALAQIEALLAVLPLRRVLLWDLDPVPAQALRARLLASSELEVQIASELAQATHASDVIVTCTSSKQAFLGLEHVRAGCFIAAVGSDSPHKSEIEPALMAAALVVVDSLTQCLEMGDLHHAIQAGAMTAAQVHAQLGELVCTSRSGRSDPEQICLFDSTGVAVQDVASAALVYERARARGVGMPWELATP